MTSARFLILGSITVSLIACTPVETPSDGSHSAMSSSVSSQAQSMIEVGTPLPNDVVKSPLIVGGMARGTWFFEASFPVKLLDDQGKVLATTQAKAQAEWMTEDFVPFTAELKFTTTANKGTLILEKDNPSGLPENAQMISIPVTF